MCILKQEYHSKENNIKMQYSNEFFNNWRWVIPQHMFISSFMMKVKCWNRDNKIFYYEWIGIMYQGR